MPRGDGSLILRRGCYYGRVWVDGRPHEESLHTDELKIAARRLADLVRRIARGDYLEPGVRRVTVEQLLEDYETHMRARGRASADTAASTMKAVKDALGATMASKLTTSAVEAVQAEWTEAGTAPATINRRFELLRAAYRLAARSRPRKVNEVPLIPMLQVHNARQGFFSPELAAAVVAAIENEDVRDYVEWLSWTAMRPGEARQLTWQMVDLDARTITLHASAAKTRRGRTIALAGPLWTIIQRRLQARRLGCPLVFHRTSKGRRGAPIRDYRKAFAAALREAGAPPEAIPYDLRRSALRNLVRAGTPETVAMSISGHRTRSTFDRYNITSAEDTRAALEQTQEWVARKRSGEPVSTGEQTRVFGKGRSRK